MPFEVCGPGERDTKWLVAVLGGNLTIKNEDKLNLFYLQLSSKGEKNWHFLLDSRS